MSDSGDDGTASYEELDARMSVTDDGHPFAPGCCTRPQAEHQASAQEIREWNEWTSTEPGLLQRLELRREQLARLEELGAPEVILAEQRRMVRDIEDQLYREEMDHGTDPAG